MVKLIDNYKYLKANGLSRRYCGHTDPKAICLAVADTDFQFSDVIKHDLIKVIEAGDLSYSFFDHELLAAINIWYKNKYQLEFNDDQFIVASGVMHLVQLTLDTLTKPGDQVVIQDPVYGPFHSVIERKGLVIASNDLIYDYKNNCYKIDYKNLEMLFSQPATKVFLLCNPQNPTGECWDRQELSKMYELALKHDVFIISDEIWESIVFNGGVHHPIFTVNKHKENCIVLNSGGKTSNLGGAQMAFGICYNQSLLERIKITLARQIDYATTNYLSFHLLKSGFSQPEAWGWNAEYVKLIESNQNYLAQELHNKAKIKVLP